MKGGVLEILLLLQFGITRDKEGLEGVGDVADSVVDLVET